MELWRRLALDPAAHRLVTLVGGGGKTTLLYALARQAVDAGYTVAVTTTTHILPHPGLPRSERPTRALLEARRAARRTRRPCWTWPAWCWWRGTGPTACPSKLRRSGSR